MAKTLAIQTDFNYRTIMAKTLPIQTDFNYRTIMAKTLPIQTDCSLFVAEAAVVNILCIFRSRTSSTDNMQEYRSRMLTNRCIVLYYEQRKSGVNSGAPEVPTFHVPQ
jgi:hypothetical protein